MRKKFSLVNKQFKRTYKGERVGMIDEGNWAKKRGNDQRRHHPTFKSYLENQIAPNLNKSLYISLDDFVCWSMCKSKGT